MRYLEMREPKKIVKEALIIFLTLLLLTFVDIVVVVRIFAPLSAAYSIPWTTVDISIGPFVVKLFLWHLAFMPLAAGFFILLGFAARSWRLALVGNWIFFSGWEDIAFFVTQFQAIPKELSWLDQAILINWTRLFTQTEHVTNIGLVVSAITNALMAAFVLFFSLKRLALLRLLRQGGDI